MKNNQQSPTPEPQSINYELWEHMHDEHGLTLLESELDDIIHLASGSIAKAYEVGYDVGFNNGVKENPDFQKFMRYIYTWYTLALIGIVLLLVFLCLKFI